MTKNKKSDPQLQRLQTTIDYQFKQPALLEQALTHKSYSKDNNERLEFIGDAVLGYIVGCMLYRSYPEVQEDALSLMRAQLVRGATLAEIAQKLELSDCLRLGSGEAKSGGRSRASILADAVEAIIGAMHEDGGIVPCKVFVEQLFSSLMGSLDSEYLKDAKTRLQEALQRKGYDLPRYQVDKVSGADHQRHYTVSCRVEEMAIEASAQARSRRAAEKAAAEIVLQQVVGHDLAGDKAGNENQGSAKSPVKRKAKQTAKNKKPTTAKAKAHVQK